MEKYSQLDELRLQYIPHIDVFHLEKKELNVNGQ